MEIDNITKEMMSPDGDFKKYPLKEALEMMGDEWIDDGEYCAQDLVDLRDILKLIVAKCNTERLEVIDVTGSACGDINWINGYCPSCEKQIRKIDNNCMCMHCKVKIKWAQ